MRRPSAPSVLLLGEPGNGKTFSLPTLLKHKTVKKLMYLYTDPGGDEALYDGLKHYEVPVSNFHLKYVPPASEGWDVLRSLTTKIMGFDYEALAKIKSGIDKQDHRQMFELLDSLSNFTCDRTGENFGAADEWPEEFAFAFDGLTGLNNIARDATVGAKPTLHQGEWGVAMSMEEKFLRKLVSGIKGPRAILGHLDLIKDDVSGRMLLQVSMLGNKLAPNIPHLFSDVVYASRDGKEFRWSTSDTRMALKSRNLPVHDKIDPDFGIVLDRWQERIEWAEAKDEPETS